MYGPEAAVEARGLGYDEVAAANPALVYARCRPSRTATGEVDDYALLVEARAGFCIAAGRPPPGTDAGGRAGQRVGGGVPAGGVGAGAAAAAGAHGRGRLVGDVPVRRDAGHPRLHDRPVRAGGAEDRVVLGGGLVLPALPLPLPGRRAAADLVRRQGHVRQGHRGAGRRAQRGGLLRRADERPAQRPRRALAGGLRHGAPGRVDRPPAVGGGGVRADPGAGRGAGRAAPGGGRPGGAGGRRGPRRCPAGPADRGPAAARGARAGAAARPAAAGGRPGRRLLGVRGRPAGRRGPGGPGRRGDQGRAAGGRGDAGGRVRDRGVPAGQAQPGPRHLRPGGPPGRRPAAAHRGRRPAQLPGRRRRAPRHRRGLGRRRSTRARSTATPAPSAAGDRGRRTRATTP